MSDRFRTLMDELRRDVLRPQQQACFDAARTRHVTLARYADMASVLDALADERECAYPEREALTRALLAEHRSRHGTFWSSALVCAYYPMLIRLRGRLVTSSVSRDDRDQLVLTAFLSVLEDVPIQQDRLAMRLRQRTARKVYRWLRQQRDPVHADVDVDAIALEGPDPFDVWQEQCDRAALLVRVAARTVSPPDVGALVALILGHEHLRAYVSRTVQGDDQRRERTYQRLKKQRTRVLQRVRWWIEACERDEPSAWLS